MQKAMKIVILNGAEADDAVHRLALAAEAKALSRGASVRTFHLRHMSVAPCLGEFDCWVRTPGRCRIPDEGQEIARASHDADIVVRVTPVVFGGYGATMKTAMDRHVPLILPFFRQTKDFTHHQLRYGDGAHLVTLGIDATPSAERRWLFRALAESNAVNKGCPTWHGEVLGDDPARWDAALDRALDDRTGAGDASGSPEGAKADLLAAIHADPGRTDAELAGHSAKPSVAMLIGSPRETGQSTSRAIAAYLGERFASHGVAPDLVAASAFVRGEKAAEAATDRLLATDLIFVIAPIYVDALPGPAVAALRRLAAARADHVKPASVVGIVNCGFPEPEQTRYAFALIKAFAHDADYRYAGGLPIGGGEAIDGTSLIARGPVTSHIRAALDAAVDHLVVGRAIPHAVSDTIAARSTLPPALYRMVGTAGWYAKGLSNHVAPWAMRQAPLDDVSEERWAAMALAGSTRARPLRVIAKHAETPDAVTILFEDPAHDPLVFEAGQYMTLEAVIEGARLRRSYSIATIPRDKAIAITVKRVAGGLMSNWLHDALKVGDLIRSFGPSGRFVAGPEPEAGRRLLLIAGGSGIVPLQAIARQALGEEAAAQVTLIYGAASAERMIGHDGLMQLADDHDGRFRLHLVLENGAPGGGPRLDAAGLAPILNGLDLAAFDRAMLCGPDGMRAAVRAELIRRGLPEDRIVEESFVSPRGGPVSDRPQQATFIDAAGATRSFAVAPDQTLLEAALDAGEAIPLACMSGGCGACQVEIAKGRGNLRLDEPNAYEPSGTTGLVPACLCRLTGPVVFSRVTDGGARTAAQRRAVMA
jgi:ferredoxin-NADP reductase/multimeric flavodoxin WrbA